MGKFSRKPKFGLVLLLIAVPLTLFFNNCGSAPNEANDATALGANCGESLPASLKDPRTIDQAVNLIQALPKPLTIDCFIKALKKPLQIYAVDNAFSAQPSAGPDSPRIFMINGNLILSVVPAGTGRRLLELAQRVSPTASIKGEIMFPVDGALSANTPYNRILDPGGFGTSCRVCHSNEGRDTSIKAGEAYASSVLRPESSKRVTQTYLKSQALSCNSQKDPYRCQMLQSIFVDGQAQDALAFP